MFWNTPNTTIYHGYNILWRKILQEPLPCPYPCRLFLWAPLTDLPTLIITPLTKTVWTSEMYWRVIWSNRGSISSFLGAKAPLGLASVTCKCQPQKVSNCNNLYIFLLDITISCKFHANLTQISCKFHANLTHISCKSHAYLMQISCKSHTYLMQISGKFQENFRKISGKSQANVSRISGKYLANLRQISDKSQANIRQISGKYHANFM